ncbi:unnamed protein product [Diplocarpon coronariae]|uniref:Uncharacterized protein n=1 Tax=Diplocarpon coronariae TaxID=2795749 RepID=A0A218Z5Z5_9HELO|nr:hypothetical protein B2J93_6469 [Marssonina coronariae]
MRFSALLQLVLLASIADLGQLGYASSDEVVTTTLSASVFVSTGVVLVPQWETVTFVRSDAAMTTTSYSIRVLPYSTSMIVVTSTLLTMVSVTLTVPHDDKSSTISASASASSAFSTRASTSSSNLPFSTPKSTSALVISTKSEPVPTGILTDAKNEKMKPGIIGGSVATAFIVLAAVLVGGWFLRRCLRKRKIEKERQRAENLEQFQLPTDWNSARAPINPELASRSPYQCNTVTPIVPPMSPPPRPQRPNSLTGSLIKDMSELPNAGVLRQGALSNRSEISSPKPPLFGRTMNPAPLNIVKRKLDANETRSASPTNDYAQAHAQQVLQRANTQEIATPALGGDQAHSPSGLSTHF